MLPESDSTSSTSSSVAHYLVLTDSICNGRWVTRARLLAHDCLCFVSAELKVCKSNGKNRTIIEGRVFPTILNELTPLMPLKALPWLAFTTLLYIATFVALTPQNAHFAHSPKLLQRMLTYATSSRIRKRLLMAPIVE